MSRLSLLAREIVACERCPRLVAHRREIARVKRKAYRDETYWGKPIPGFGDPSAWLVIVGLAPGAHGANRTGRAFTGDRSGEFLYAALHRAGFANQPESTSRRDGLTLSGAFITLPVRCVPPDNRPSNDEIDACRPFFVGEMALLRRASVFLALGSIAWAATAAALGVRPPPFSHGARVTLSSDSAASPSRTLLGSYHVSQQNTQTGRLSAGAFDAVLAEARRARARHEPL